MIPNLEYCKVFYYVAKASSITLAAQQLYISQPAVSQSIRQLEQELNCTLFSRTSKGVRLTPEGETFYNHVKNGYEEILLGEKKLSEMLNFENGEIRIGASDMTLQYFLLPHLEHFHKLYPKIKISVTNGPTPETMNALRDGRIDFGLVSSPVSDSKGIVVTPLDEIRDIFVAGERFNHLKNKVIELNELERLPIICLEKNTSTRKSIDNFLEKKGVRLSPEIELATSELIVRFTQRNLGIGFVMNRFAQESIDNGKLFELQLAKELPRRNICLITTSGATISGASSKMLELINSV